MALDFREAQPLTVTRPSSQVSELIPVARKTIDVDGAESAIADLLVDKGILTREELQAQIDNPSRPTPHLGAQLVARALVQQLVRMASRSIEIIQRERRAGCLARLGRPSGARQCPGQRRPQRRVLRIPLERLTQPIDGGLGVGRRMCGPEPREEPLPRRASIPGALWIASLRLAEVTQRLFKRLD